MFQQLHRMLQEHSHSVLPVYSTVLAIPTWVWVCVQFSCSRIHLLLSSFASPTLGYLLWPDIFAATNDIAIPGDVGSTSEFTPGQTLQIATLQPSSPTRSTSRDLKDTPLLHSLMVNPPLSSGTNSFFSTWEMPT